MLAKHHQFSAGGRRYPLHSLADTSAGKYSQEGESGQSADDVKHDMYGHGDEEEEGVDTVNPLMQEEEDDDLPLY